MKTEDTVEATTANVVPVALDGAAYTTPVKMKGYLRKAGITPFQASNPRDAANVIIANHPSWTKEDHTLLAAAHVAEKNWHEREWSRIADDAALAAWGRKYQFGDYRISGIASNEFSPEAQDVLRTHAHDGAKHDDLACAHTSAASSRRVKDGPGELEGYVVARTALPLKDVLVVDGVVSGEHHGPIKSVIGNEVIQSAGQGRTVTHDARNLDVVPKEGDKAAIKYGKDGMASVKVGNEKSQAKDHGR